MGTNFYFGKDEEIHIGKRSAAGNYCWDCGMSLANKAYDKWDAKTKYGINAVHYGNADDWLKRCPICGKKPEEEGWNNAAGRELGFNKKTPTAKTGVKTCSSFTWAIEPKSFQELFLDSKKPVFDEYGNKFTRHEFMNILSECPIKKYTLIGKEFS